MRAALNKTRQLKYEAERLKDRTLARRKVFFPDKIRKHVTPEADTLERAELPLPASDIAENDTGLPAPTISDRARYVELWCKHGSWVICDTCGALRPRPLQPVDLRRVAPPTVPKCAYCRRGEYVPQPGDVPAPLRDLGHASVGALRPLEIDTGVYERAQYGYRIHNGMVSFAWAKDDVVDKIAALPKRRHRVAARAAYDHLMNSNETAYREWIKRHRDFLRRRPHADERQRKQPLRFIEEEGLECAVWPQLYWRTDLCETVERATDVRRLQARHTGLANFASSRRKSHKHSDGANQSDREDNDSLGTNDTTDSDAEDVTKGAPRVRRLPTQSKYIAMIRAGTKIVEGRIRNGIAAEIRVGDLLQFGDVTKKVAKVLHFKGFKDMLETVGVKKALPDCQSVREGVAVYHNFRNYADLARRYGVVAFQFDKKATPPPRGPRMRRRRRVEDSSEGSDAPDPGARTPENDTDQSSDSEKEHGRHSIRKSFLRKVPKRANSYRPSHFSPFPCRLKL